MICLEDGRHELKQWDTGVFVLTNDACSWLEVSRDGMQEAQRVDVKRVGGNLRARIPDELMTQPGYLQIAAVNEDRESDYDNDGYNDWDDIGGNGVLDIFEQDSDGDGGPPRCADER